MPDQLYPIEDRGGEGDYLSDEGLDVIAAVLDRLPHAGFDLTSMQAHPKSVTATIAFDGKHGPAAQADALEAVLLGATVLRSLHANLVAARAALRPAAAGDGPITRRGLPDGRALLQANFMIGWATYGNDNVDVDVEDGGSLPSDDGWYVDLDGRSVGPDEFGPGYGSLDEALDAVARWADQRGFEYHRPTVHITVGKIVEGQ